MNEAIFITAAQREEEADVEFPFPALTEAKDERWVLMRLYWAHLSEDQQFRHNPKEVPGRNKDAFRFPKSLLVYPTASVFYPVQ